MKIRLIILLIFIAVFTLVFVFYKPKSNVLNINQPINNNQNQNFNGVIQNTNLGRPQNNNTNNNINSTPSTAFFPPISDYQNWVTKKPFGIYITSQNSPVQPEKFTGYHTGTDFETYPSEANLDVPVYAFCNGKILVKKFASGYGGVLVQSGVVNNQSVTIIYGHLHLTSINKNVGDNLTAGEQIGVLGTGYSSETDGERKHLHFGIHKGTTVSILGYVQVKSQLDNWIDPMSLL
jgi:murein DD-endopeptidase MepM/ murein hydrolase activator NlpD